MESERRLENIIVPDVSFVFSEFRIFAGDGGRGQRRDGCRGDDGEPREIAEGREERSRWRPLDARRRAPFNHAEAGRARLARSRPLNSPPAQSTAAD